MEVNTREEVAECSFNLDFLIVTFGFEKLIIIIIIIIIRVFAPKPFLNFEKSTSSSINRIFVQNQPHPCALHA
jgi:uncharacterized membrane protein